MSIHRLPPGKKPSPLQGLTVRQPIVSTHGGVLLVAALLTLLTEFGIPLSDGQQSAITKFIAVAGLVVAGWLARRKVTPTADPRDNQGRRLAPQPAEPPLPPRPASAGEDHDTGSGAGDRDDDASDPVDESLGRLFGNRDQTQGRHQLADDLAPGETARPGEPPAPPPLPGPRTGGIEP